MSPVTTARVTAQPLVLTPSFWNMALTCVFTVWIEMNISLAMARLVLPAAMSLLA